MAKFNPLRDRTSRNGSQGGGPYDQDHSRGDRGREAFQEVDVEAMFAPLAKWAHQIESADAIPAAMTRAFMAIVHDGATPEAAARLLAGG